MRRAHACQIAYFCMARRTRSHGHRHELLWLSWLPENSLRSTGELVGVSKHKADVPHVFYGKRSTVGRHTGEADTVCHLPVSLAGFIVRHPGATKEVRRLRKHALSRRSLILVD